MRDLGTRDWLRAGVITFMLIAHGIYAIPNPANLDRRDLRTLEGAEEMQRWTELLNGVGVDVTTVQLEDFTLWWTAEANRLHRWMKTPFRPMFRATRTNQSWALFASPDTHPHRLEIFARHGREWTPVFIRNHPEHDFRDRALRFRRVRGVYDGSTSKPGVPYWNFTRWIAREVLLAYPDADSVRVQMTRTHTRLPWEEPDRERKIRVRREHKRSSILPDDGLVP